jgi:hypothetical protein
VSAPDQPEQIAQQFADRYANLLAAAANREVGDDEIDAAGIARSTTEIRRRLDFYTCAYAGQLDWAGSATLGHARIIDVDRADDGRLQVRAELFVTHPSDLYTPGGEYDLDVVHQAGKWAVVAEKYLPEFKARGADGPEMTGPESSIENPNPSRCEWVA